MRSFFRAKIHRATVTQADLDYEGSLSIDRDLMDAADIAEFEEVHVWNVTRGTRLSNLRDRGGPRQRRHLRQWRGRAPGACGRPRYYNDLPSGGARRGCPAAGRGAGRRE